MTKVESYRDLVVWQKAMALAAEIYRAAASLPREETYGLRSQITRAATSIPTNIAEGRARHGTGELIQFLGIARGSLAELETLVLLCGRVEFFPNDLCSRLLVDCEEVGKMLTALTQSLRRI